MIDVLEQLVADGKHREAIKLAEQILKDGVDGPAPLVIVQRALVQAHFGLQEWEAAVAPGEAVLGLAPDVGDWDSFGEVAMYISTAYSRLGREDLAVARAYDYIAHLGQYHAAAIHEVLAWFNLSGSFLRMGRPSDAATALTKALRVAERRGDHRNAHGLRHALINAALKAHDYKPIPRLLAQSLVYLRHNPEVLMIQDSWAYHMRLRAEYALATGRPRRAMAVALRGLQRANDAPHHACRFHLLLARVAQSQSSPFEAVGHVLAAQSLAKESGRPDVSTEASEAVYEISHAFPEAVRGVEKYYLLQ